MNKYYKILFLFFSLTFASFSFAEKKEVEYTMDSGNKMDENWYLYFSTGDELYLENVIAYTDSQDLLTKKINENYKSFYRDEKFMNILKDFGGQVGKDKVEFFYDLEMTAAFRIKDESSTEKINYIYSFFPRDLFIRGVMKNTAFWSVVSNAEQNEVTNIAVQKRIPYINKKGQGNYYSYMNLDKEIGYRKSDKGSCAFQNKDILITAALVNNLEETLHQWYSLESSQVPKIESSVNVNAKENKIAPFIAFNIKEQKDFPLYYDCQLIKTDGSVSKVKGNKLLLVQECPSNKNMLYAANKSFVWEFDESDKKGKYTINICVYSEKKVICVFDLDFTIAE